jgi:hypothetical protein
VPDLDIGVLDHAARLRVQDREAQNEREARLPRANIAPGEGRVDPVRPPGHLGCEEAGGRRLCVVAQEFEGPGAEHGGEAGASDRLQHISSVQLGVHVGSFH